MNRTIRIVGIVGVLWLTVLPAQAAGHAEHGQTVVSQRCVSCHVAEAGKPGEPTLFAIAKRHQQNKTWVYRWLSGRHPAMPNVNLTQQEIADVIAYLDTLPAD